VKKPSSLILCMIFATSVLLGCGNEATSTQPHNPSQATHSITSPPSTSQAPSSVQNQTKNAESPKYFGSGPNGEGIKGHIDSRGVKIYHIPGDPYYDRTIHVAQWFFTEKDAQDAGYRPIKR